MRRGKLDRLWDERGISLVEILVGVVILTIVLLSLAAAGGVAAKQVYLGRTDMHRWTAMQQQMEELVRLGYDSVTTSSAVVQGYPMSWTVSGTNPKKVLLLIERTNFFDETVEDTLVLYFADPDPGS